MQDAIFVKRRYRWDACAFVMAEVPRVGFTALGAAAEGFAGVGFSCWDIVDSCSFFLFSLGGGLRIVMESTRQTFESGLSS